MHTNERLADATKSIHTPAVRLVGAFKDFWGRCEDDGVDVIDVGARVGERIRNRFEDELGSSDICARGAKGGLAESEYSRLCCHFVSMSTA